MTSKSKNTARSFETEIEKSREDSNWKRAIELAQQLKTRAPQLDSLSFFLLGESKLELYLEENPPTKENHSQAERELNETKGLLTLATNESGKASGVDLDAHLLLGKVNFALGDYKSALDHFRRAALHTLTEKELSVRSIKIVAESYAIKGLCLEQIEQGSSKFKQAEKDAEILKCFELAADLTLVFLQKTNSPHIRAGLTLETALQRVPILHMRAGRLSKAIECYREMLSTVESASTGPLRLTLARQLAEVLLRGGHSKGGDVRQCNGKSSSSTSPWKPTTYQSLNQFVPRNDFEEILLVLMVAEALAAHQAVLSQSPEFHEARKHSYENAAAIYDLLALACIRWGHVALLNESLDRAMKFSFRAEHVWRQRALATSALVTHPHHNPLSTQPPSIMNSTAVRAKMVAKETILLLEKDTPLRIMAASNCYKMGQISEGLEIANAALAIEKEKRTFMEARCYLYVGIGYQLQAKTTSVRIERQASNEKALKHLLKATQLDGNDHMAFYYLGLQYAFMECYNDAMDATRACLSAWCESACGLRLLAALGSPRPQLVPLRAAAQSYPDCLWLATAHALLAPPEEAWRSGRQFVRDACEEARRELETHDNSSDADKERSISIAACSFNDKVLKNDRRAPAWLLMAKICLRLGKVNEAADCVAEAAAILPFSHETMFTRGMVEGARGDWELARASFVDALALSPHYWDSMLQLGIALHRLGRSGAAEGVLRAAAARRPTHPAVWAALAPAVRACSDKAASGAADCAAVALQLRKRTPALSIYDLPEVFT